MFNMPSPFIDREFPIDSFFQSRWFVKPGNDTVFMDSDDCHLCEWYPAENTFVIEMFDYLLIFLHRREPRPDKRRVFTHFHPFHLQRGQIFVIV
jgi:hypothetical protein